MVEPLANPQDSQTPVEYVGFGLRFVAFLIDSTAVAIAISPIIATLIGETSVSDYDLESPQEILLLLERLSLQLLLDLLFMGTIFVLFWIFKSATPGKMIFRSSIVDAETLGKASPLQNILRYISYYISLFPLGIGFLWIAIDPRKQGWHDKIARTVVIKGPPRNSARVSDDSS